MRILKREGTIHSILFIRSGDIGDAFLLIPAILALRKKFPYTQISVLAGHSIASAFQLCQEVDELLLYDHTSDLLTLLQNSYDVAVSYTRLTLPTKRIV